MINVTVKPLFTLEENVRHFSTKKWFTLKLNKKELQGLYLQNYTGRQTILFEVVVTAPLMSDLIFYAVNDSQNISFVPER